MDRLKDFIDGFCGDDLVWRSIEMWGNPSSWPIETDDHLFLARAVNLLGAAMFKEHWSGSEPVEASFPVVDGSFVSNGFEGVYALSLLWRFRPDLGLIPKQHRNLITHPLSQMEWDSAAAVYREHEADRLSASRGRYQAVVSALMSGAAAGRIRTYRRAVERAEKYIEIPQSNWLSEDASPRFNLCLYSPFDPYFGAVVPMDTWKSLPANVFSQAELSRAWPEYIFTARADIQAMVGDGVNDSPSPVAGLPFHRPNLTPTQKAIDAAIKQLFPQGHLPPRPMDRHRIIIKHFRASGLAPPSPKTIDRYFARFLSN
ncbi:hypothetical protein FJ976_01660 [Mesorhizobium sp. B1-1-9]|uniref:hypothetical protein n=1 Tax=Mesorhizobium sp. B1-1-9 TaxID=2589975 RepID=UPI0011297A7C|nr:hypothetical protein [Mesorhizobium sp. B1-1-9]TPN58642.1 hypothetical protein FJ976_01660 [Mesorhizobium sp. B1-1-9]